MLSPRGEASASHGGRFPHLFEVEDLLPLERSAVFAFFAEAENLERITPPELHFEIRSPRPLRIERGALIDYRLKLAGAPFSWRTRIAEWDPPRRFVDEQLTGPYRSWVHEHEFVETEQGTLLRDRVTYRLPFAPFGEIALPFVRRELRRIFIHRQRRVREILLGERL